MKEDLSVFAEPGFWVALVLALSPLFAAWGVIYWVQQ